MVNNSTHGQYFNLILIIDSFPVIKVMFRDVIIVVGTVEVIRNSDVMKSYYLQRQISNKRKTKLEVPIHRN